MGVDYSAVSGYGIVLSPIEVVEWATLAGNDEEYAYEAADYLCSKYNLNHVVAGSAYTGEEEFLIGECTGVDKFGFVESDGFAFITNECYPRLKAMMQDIGKTKPVGFYSGMHVY